jgi:hypothetical protein
MEQNPLVIEGDESSIGEPEEVQTEAEKVAEIKDKFKVAEEFWKPIHQDLTDDKEFAQLGKQWDDKTVNARKIEGLSSLVYNKFPALYKYIVNNVRANLPGIKVNPISDGANKNTAKVRDGIIKSIGHQSNAKSAYINALIDCVIGGIGGWKVTPVDEGGEPSLAVDRIIDMTTVFFDPSAVKQGYLDAEYVFEEIWLDDEQVKARIKASGSNIDVEELETGTGTKKDKIRILCYWFKNPATGYVERYLISGDRILEHLNTYKGCCLPIVIITGEEVNIGNERRYKGIVRDNKDIQRYINLAKSREADWMGRSANAQWLVEEKHISKYPKMWNSANVSGVPVLVYSPGEGGSAPQKQEPPAPPIGFMQVGQAASDDLRQAVAIRDPLKDIPATQSGKAIELQISQADIGTYEYIDNLKAGLKQTGEIMNDLIPHIFSYPHIRQIMGIDDQITTVPVNQPYIENGQQVMHDLTKGKYSITLSEGPDYESQRAEAADKLMELSAKYPEIMQIAGDIMFKQFSFDGAEEIAARMRASIPPQILAASSASNGDSDSQLGAMQSQNQQMGMELQQAQAAIQQLQQQLQQATQAIQTKVVEINAKHQADVELENLKFEHEMALKEKDIEGEQKKIVTEAHAEEHLHNEREAGSVIKEHLFPSPTAPNQRTPDVG